MTDRYKFRAECVHDIFELAKALPQGFVMLEIEPAGVVGLPDAVATITLKKMSLGDLRKAMKTVPDSHVMIETVTSPEAYTGKRIPPGSLSSSSFARSTSLKKRNFQQKENQCN